MGETLTVVTDWDSVFSVKKIMVKSGFWEESSGGGKNFSL